MKLSALITNYNPNEPLLIACFKAIQAVVDEVVIVSSKQSSLGEKINQGLKMTKGDYVLILNDDAVYSSGNVQDLCVPNAISCPQINGNDLPFHAHAFCVPRYIFEATGGYDEGYEHAYYDDWDFWRNVEQHGFDKVNVRTVNFTHPPDGANTINNIPNKGEWQERNRQRYYNKWGEKARFGA